MSKFTIKKLGTETILFEGRFNTLKGCVEKAVEEGVNLDYADLSGANLMNAELDEGSFQHARFDYANLSGVNLSGANLMGASFREAALYNACLCEAKLIDAQFFGASFGGSDVAWADLNGASFDTLSALDLNFSQSLMMQNAHFYDRTGTICAMSRPPVILNGLQNKVIFFDEYMKVGAAVFPYQSWKDLKDNGALQSLGGEAAAFMRVYGDSLLALAAVRSQGVSEVKLHVRKNVA